MIAQLDFWKQQVYPPTRLIFKQVGGLGIPHPRLELLGELQKGDEIVAGLLGPHSALLLLFTRPLLEKLVEASLFLANCPESLIPAGASSDSDKLCQYGCSVLLDDAIRGAII